MRMSGAHVGPPPKLLTVSGEALRPYVPALARLRIAGFRDFPYLYEGEAAYEERYLGTDAESPRAAIVLAIGEGEVVGASTCLPLLDETPNIQAPFLERWIDLARVFYFGESVLLHAWRGHGLGLRFFAEREAHVRRVSDCDIVAFCAVERATDHPARPIGYVPLDAFW